MSSWPTHGVPRPARPRGTFRGAGTERPIGDKDGEGSGERSVSMSKGRSKSGVVL